MHTEDLVVDESSNGETVETVGETLPQAHVVSSLALIVEAVNTVDRSAFVIASEEKEVELVFELVGKEKAYGLYAPLTTINVVSEEQVICSWRVAAVLKQPQEVWKLTMNITANLDRSLELEEIRLAEKNLFGSRAELAYLSLE